MAPRGGKSITTRRIERLVFADGSFVEGTIVQFTPSLEQPLGVDYRLAYVTSGGTVRVLYDNQGGHAPHRHIEGKREPHSFLGLDRLVEDFLADLDRVRQEP